MNNYQKSLIEEHSQLQCRIESLNNYVYSGEAEKNDDKVEFANKCIQLASMKKYEEALRARMENADIVFDGNDYYHKVAGIKRVNVELPMPEKGSDYDVDKEKISKDEVDCGN